MITRREAAVIGAYTGYALGPFEDIAALATELLGRPISAHALGWGGAGLSAELREAAKPLFLALPVEGEP